MHGYEKVQVNRCNLDERLKVGLILTLRYKCEYSANVELYLFFNLFSLVLNQQHSPSFQLDLDPEEQTLAISVGGCGLKSRVNILLQLFLLLLRQLVVSSAKPPRLLFLQLHLSNSLDLSFDRPQRP